MFFSKLHVYKCHNYTVYLTPLKYCLGARLYPMPLLGHREEQNCFLIPTLLCMIYLNSQALLYNSLLHSFKSRCSLEIKITRIFYHWWYFFLIRRIVVIYVLCVDIAKTLMLNFLSCSKYIIKPIISVAYINI